MIVISVCVCLAWIVHGNGAQVLVSISMSTEKKLLDFSWVTAGFCS